MSVARGVGGALMYATESLGFRTVSLGRALLVRLSCTVAALCAALCVGVP